MLYGAPEVPRQEREPVGQVIHSPLTGLRGGASERSSLVSLPWMKISRKIIKIKKFKNRREMKGWGGGTCETK
jgi:hypothetical protein